MIEKENCIFCGNKLTQLFDFMQELVGCKLCTSDFQFNKTPFGATYFSNHSVYENAWVSFAFDGVMITIINGENKMSIAPYRTVNGVTKVRVNDEDLDLPPYDITIENLDKFKNMIKIWKSFR